MSSITEQIKERIDIVPFIAQHVPDLKKAGRLYKACCPFHPEKSPSFVVNPLTQTWRCFGACAEGGDIFNFYTKLHNVSFSVALQELGKQAGIEVRPQTPQQKEQDARLDRLRGMLQTAAEYYHQHLHSSDPKAQETLRYTREKRGFTDKTIKEFLIGYAPAGWSMMLDALKKVGYTENEIFEGGLASRNDSGRVYDRFRNRLMIPIRDERGRVTGFGARALDPEDTPKYLNSPQSVLFDKSRTLFGLDMAKNAISDSGMAVIVEGYMDAIQAHQAGFRNVVAQMGTALTETQIKLLVPRHTKKIILALDADAAGQNATRRSLEVARTTLQADYAGKLGVDMRILHIDDAKDPDDVLRETPKKWQGYIDSAKPAAEFLIDVESAGLSATATVQERQAAAQRILPILSASEDNLYRRDNLQKLAVRLHVPETDLLTWAEEIRRQEAQRRKSTPTMRRPPSNAHLSSEGVAPLPEGEINSEEPPPFFGSYGDVPPDYDDYNILPDFSDLPSGQKAAAADAKPALKTTPMLTASGFQTRHTSRRAEEYCLQMMLKEPTLLYAANRKLREPAQQANTPIAMLRDMSEEDFSQSDFRILFATLLQAMEQDDAEPLAYMQVTLDELLKKSLDELLMEEYDQVHNRLNRRLSADFTTLVKNYQKSTRPTIDMRADFLKRTLQLRINRLQREIQELRFLIAEADEQTGDTLSQQLIFLNSSLNMLQVELYKTDIPK